MSTVIHQLSENNTISHTTMLSLCQVQDRDDSGCFVTLRVVLQDYITYLQANSSDPVFASNVNAIQKHAKSNKLKRKQREKKKCALYCKLHFFNIAFYLGVSLKCHMARNCAAWCP